MTKEKQPINPPYPLIWDTRHPDYWRYECVIARINHKTLTAHPNNPEAKAACDTCVETFERIKAGATKEDFLKEAESYARKGNHFILLDWDGSDLWEDTYLKAKGRRDYWKVMDFGALGFSTKGKLITALYCLTDSHLEKNGCRMKVCYRALVQGQDYEFHPNKKGKAENGFDIYVSLHAVIMIYLRRSLGLGKMVRPIIDPDRLKFKEMAEHKVNSSIARIKEETLPPYLKKAREQQRLHDKWMAEHPDPY
jgi:hypothetical protein